MNRPTDPAEFDEANSRKAPAGAGRVQTRETVTKARQDIERVSALLRKLEPGLVAGETPPADRDAEAGSSRWPLILAFGISGLVWTAVALALWG
ncbi:MAG: hypothetical protein WDN31_01730 [Hyphomicrobium sp.]